MSPQSSGSKSPHPEAGTYQCPQCRAQYRHDQAYPHWLRQCPMTTTETTEATTDE